MNYIGISSKGIPTMMMRITAGFAVCLALLCSTPARAQTVITLGCAASSGTTCTTVGPGRTYGDWHSLTYYYSTTNPSAATLTQPMQIQVYNDGVPVPSDGSALTVTSSATYTLTLMPAAGQGFANTVGHLVYDPTRGAAIEAGGGSGYAVNIVSAYVTVTGLELRDGISDKGALLITSASGGIVNVTGNILSSASTFYGTNQVVYGKQTVTDNVIIVENYNNSFTVKQGLNADSSGPGTVIANNIIAIPQGSADWIGVNLSSSGNQRTVKDNIIVGFPTAINVDTNPYADGYNATNASSFTYTMTGGQPGIAYTTANFTAPTWTTPYGPSATLDLTPTATSVFKGAGSPAPVVTADIFGRSFSSDIGPFKLSSGPTYDATKMFLTF